LPPFGSIIWQGGRVLPTTLAADVSLGRKAPVYSISVINYYSTSETVFC
jgi:hypothetical protein